MMYVAITYTLNEAVLAGNWPTLASARGKVIFLMDQRPVGPVYLAGHPSLRGRVLFTNAEPGEPDAAFIERNDGPAADITELVKKGYLVRTRTDADTKEARTNDTARRDAMIASGAQILSTDYPVNEPAHAWPGNYVVQPPGTILAPWRITPSAPAAYLCQNEALAIVFVEIWFSIVRLAVVGRSRPIFSPSSSPGNLPGCTGLEIPGIFASLIDMPWGHRGRRSTLILLFEIRALVLVVQFLRLVHGE